MMVWIPTNRTDKLKTADNEVRGREMKELENPITLFTQRETRFGRFHQILEEILLSIFFIITVQWFLDAHEHKKNQKNVGKSAVKHPI